MAEPDDALHRQIRGELLARAIALGDELVRLADDLGQSIAATHICQGLEMMRDEVGRLTGEG